MIFVASQRFLFTTNARMVLLLRNVFFFHHECTNGFVASQCFLFTTNARMVLLLRNVFFTTNARMVDCLMMN